MTNQTHDHTWITASTEGHSGSDGSGILISLTQYCDECGQVSRYYQSASTCEWHRTLEPEQVILDEDGTPLGTRTDYSRMDWGMDDPPATLVQCLA